MNWKGHGRWSSCHSLRYYPNHCLDMMRQPLRTCWFKPGTYRTRTRNFACHG